MHAVGNGPGIREKALLAIRFVTRSQISSCATVGFITAANAEPQPLQRNDAGGSPGLKEQPPGKRFVIVRVLGRSRRRAVIRRAVKNSSRITYRASEQIAVQLETNIAVRHQARCERPLIERRPRIRLQRLQSNRRFEAASFHLQCRIEAIVQKRVINHHATAAKIGGEIKIEIMENCAGENRARATEQKCVLARGAAAVVNERPAVRLNQAVQRGDKIGIRRTEAESILAKRQFRLCLGGRIGGFLVQLAMALKNPNLLIEVLDLFLIRVANRLLFHFALLFEVLDLLIQCLDFLFQGFYFRGFRGSGGGGTGGGTARIVGGDFNRRAVGRVGGLAMGSN